MGRPKLNLSIEERKEHDKNLRNSRMKKYSDKNRDSSELNESRQRLTKKKTRLIDNDDSLKSQIAGKVMETQARLDSMNRYISPVYPAIYPHLSLVLLGIGVFLTAWFSVLEVSGGIKGPKGVSSRSAFKELTLGLAGSIFAGCGLLFLLLHAGIYL